MELLRLFCLKFEGRAVTMIVQLVELLLLDPIKESYALLAQGLTKPETFMVHLVTLAFFDPG